MPNREAILGELEAILGVLKDRAQTSSHHTGPHILPYHLREVTAGFKRLKQSELLILMLSLSFSFNKRK